jgi:hypothetical protein
MKCYTGKSTRNFPSTLQYISKYVLFWYKNIANQNPNWWSLQPNVKLLICEKDFVWLYFVFILTLRRILLTNSELSAHIDFITAQ